MAEGPGVCVAVGEGEGLAAGELIEKYMADPTMTAITMATTRIFAQEFFMLISYFLNLCQFFVDAFCNFLPSSC